MRWGTEYRHDRRFIEEISNPGLTGAASSGYQNQVARTVVPSQDIPGVKNDEAGAKVAEEIVKLYDSEIDPEKKVFLEKIVSGPKMGVRVQVKAKILW